MIFSDKLEFYFKLQKSEKLVLFLPFCSEPDEINMADICHHGQSLRGSKDLQKCLGSTETAMFQITPCSNKPRSPLLESDKNLVNKDIFWNALVEN